MLNYTISENPNYSGPDRFSVLTCGDRYLLTVNGHKACFVPSFDAAEQLIRDPGSWLRRLYA